MRWIILVLLFMNIGYFAWGTYQQSLQSYEQPSRRTSEVQQGKRLVLWSESGRDLPKSELLPGPVVFERPEHSPEQPLEEIDKKCLLLGPFPSSKKADQIQQRLFSLGIPSREKSDTENLTYDYWVHIPPLSGREAAIRLLRELQGQEIDSFVITQGELANGISLGLFSKEVSANKVSSRLLQAGYETRIKKLARQPRVFWLELTQEHAGKLTAELQEEFAEEYNDLKILEKNCKGIASGDSIH